MGEKERITIMVNHRLLKKIRNRQAKEISETQKSMSFSRQVNEDLAKYYKMQNFEY